MVSDSIANASITCAPSAKDSGKKKRVHRSAKLKQYKLDVRCEQWLSQGMVGFPKSRGFSCNNTLDGSLIIFKDESV
ncbi:hypothetical protein SAY87_003247 [Trapa incisa]|uniref:Uncharacterized protein n=1 Tax=Trapa incisa TaxID=236973 RepID=A0AAN7QHF4_9MYRT|nr:hypothetical protein SAY87_003247 [Trapa incisa]